MNTIFKHWPLHWYCWRYPICVMDDFGNLVPVRRDVDMERETT